ncbi:MAG: glycoside hydrolase 100 family protein [Guyparkeria sp.]
MKAPGWFSRLSRRGVASNAVEREAWRRLDASIVRYRGEPVGTIASGDGDAPAQNYDHVFTRDFFVSAVAFLLRGEHEIVRNFLRVALDLQSADHHMDCFRPGQGMMPASFRVAGTGAEERLEPDFGEHAIARVTPIDSGFWWLYLLHAYTRASGDESLAKSDAMQRGIRLILELCLPPRHEMLPTLLVPDGAFMIDRRLGVYGHPLDIQVLFHLALRAADGLLDVPVDDPLRRAVAERESHLAHHLRHYYWLDMATLNRIYRYQVEELGADAANPFNIRPDTIPEWLFEWMPRDGGYFAGNLGPARLDVRLFSQGNLLAVLSGLADREQAQAILNLFESRREDLLGETPVKLVFPALEGRDWQLLTGGDPKNAPWSYHNGGNWPFLLWLFTAAAIRAGRREFAAEVLDAVEERLAAEQWAEYYDGRGGRLVGKEARLDQTWSVAGYLAARRMLANPDAIDFLGFGAPSTATSCDAGSRAPA